MIRQAVGAIVYKDDLFLVVQKTKINTLEGKKKIDGEWDVVKGGVEPVDQTLEHAILRELEEETGSSQFKVISQYQRKICFDFPSEIQNKIGYEKQETTMFLVEFTDEKETLIPKDDEIAELQFLRVDDLIQRVTHEDTKTFIIQNLSEQSRK
ncbi:NUDIX hydrolase [Fredinandcohnia sp. 179-A 10B2 NHS]|uniref:NUDIX hydrolase n=1 Tax=Fredinandcohnia sp. 179-A 10B2 NHS TaxID=3235176 RepID=UPI0039A2723F